MYLTPLNNTLNNWLKWSYVYSIIMKTFNLHVNNKILNKKGFTIYTTTYYLHRKTQLGTKKKKTIRIYTKILTAIFEAEN